MSSRELSVFWAHALGAAQVPRTDRLVSIKLSPNGRFFSLQISAQTVEFYDIEAHVVRPQ